MSCSIARDASRVQYLDFFLCSSLGTCSSRQWHRSTAVQLCNYGCFALSDFFFWEFILNKVSNVPSCNLFLRDCHFCSSHVQCTFVYYVPITCSTHMIQSADHWLWLNISLYQNISCISPICGTRTKINWSFWQIEEITWETFCTVWSLIQFETCISRFEIFEVSQKITNDIAFFVPRNANIDQVNPVLNSEHAWYNIFHCLLFCIIIGCLTLTRDWLMLLEPL